MKVNLGVFFPLMFLYFTPLLVFVSDYITKCDFDSDQSPFCDWTVQGLIRRLAGHGKISLQNYFDKCCMFP